MVLHGCEISKIEVGSGIPQGLVIGPLHFLNQINHIVSGLSYKFCRCR